MRIAVFSDVHGNNVALEAVLADIERRGVDATVGLGDFLSGPFDPVAVADRLIDMKIPLVRGNHDRWLHEGRDPDWAADTAGPGSKSSRLRRQPGPAGQTRISCGDLAAAL